MSHSIWICSVCKLQIPDAKVLEVLDHKDRHFQQLKIDKEPVKRAFNGRRKRK